MSYITLDAGAYQMAINVLERAGKHEVVEELRKTARIIEQPKEQCCCCGTTENLFKDGWYGWRCNSVDCMVF